MNASERIKRVIEDLDERALSNGTDLAQLVAAAVGQMKRPELVLIATTWLENEVRAERRHRTWLLEQQAVAESARRRAREEAELRKTKPWEVGVRPKNFTPEQYKTWVETTEEGKEYATDQKAHQAALDAIDAEYQRSTQRIIEAYADRIRIEWTQELLDAGFALPSGEIVTWGEATVAQHRQRAAMFTANAEANAQGAARHLKAVEVLTTSNAACLRDYVTSP